MSGTNTDELHSATWWPELLRLKDTLSWAALSEKFGVGAHALRRALTAAGQTKASIPPGRKPQKGKSAEAAPAAKPAKAAAPAAPTLAGLAGKKSDPEVAREARVSIAEVKAYRKANNIAPFIKGAPAPAKAVEAPAPAPAKETVVRRRKKGDAVEETRTALPAKAEAPKAEPAKAEPPKAAKGRAKAAPAGSVLDKYRDEMGKVKDDVIAAKAGVHRLEVGKYRRQLGIPSYDGHRFKKGAEEEAKAAAPAAVRGSKIDAFVDMLGQVPDAEIASLAGLSVEAVKKFRQRRNIARYEPAAPKPVVETKPAKAAKAAKPAEVKPAEVTPAEVKPAQPEATKAPALKGGDRPPRKSALLPFVDLIGVLPDREVAERAKVTVENVRMWRTRRGIPSVAQRAAGQAEAPAAPAVVTPPPAPVAAEPAPAPAKAAKAVKAPKEAKPAEVKPAEVKPAEVKPAEVKPAEVKPAEVAAGTTRHAFQVSVYNGEQKREFALIAVDMVDAARSATEALARRDGGPWRIQVVRELAESLE